MPKPEELNLGPSPDPNEAGSEILAPENHDTNPPTNEQKESERAKRVNNLTDKAKLLIEKLNNGNIEIYRKHLDEILELRGAIEDAEKTPAYFRDERILELEQIIEKLLQPEQKNPETPTENVPIDPAEGSNDIDELLDGQTPPSPTTTEIPIPTPGVGESKPTPSTRSIPIKDASEPAQPEQTAKQKEKQEKLNKILADIDRVLGEIDKKDFSVGNPGSKESYITMLNAYKDMLLSDKTNDTAFNSSFSIASSRCNIIDSLPYLPEEKPEKPIATAEQTTPPTESKATPTPLETKPSEPEQEEENLESLRNKISGLLKTLTEQEQMQTSGEKMTLPGSKIRKIRNELVELQKRKNDILSKLKGKNRSNETVPTTPPAPAESEQTAEQKENEAYLKNVDLLLMNINTFLEAVKKYPEENKHLDRAVKGFEADKKEIEEYLASGNIKKLKETYTPKILGMMIVDLLSNHNVKTPQVNSGKDDVLGLELPEDDEVDLADGDELVPEAPEAKVPEQLTKTPPVAKKPETKEPENELDKISAILKRLKKAEEAGYVVGSVAPETAPVAPPPPPNPETPSAVEQPETEKPESEPEETPEEIEQKGFRKAMSWIAKQSKETTKTIKQKSWDKLSDKSKKHFRIAAFLAIASTVGYFYANREKENPRPGATPPTVGASETPGGKTVTEENPTSPKTPDMRAIAGKPAEVKPTTPPIKTPAVVVPKAEEKEKKEESAVAERSDDNYKDERIKNAKAQAGEFNSWFSKSDIEAQVNTDGSFDVYLKKVQGPNCYRINNEAFAKIKNLHNEIESRRPTKLPFRSPEITKKQFDERALIKIIKAIKDEGTKMEADDLPDGYLKSIIEAENAEKLSQAKREHEMRVLRVKIKQEHSKLSPAEEDLLRRDTQRIDDTSSAPDKKTSQDEEITRNKAEIERLKKNIEKSYEDIP